MHLEEQAPLEMSDGETQDMGSHIMEAMKTMFVIGRSRKDFVNGTSTNEQEVNGNDGSTSTEVVKDIVTVLVCHSLILTIPGVLAHFPPLST